MDISTPEYWQTRYQQEDFPWDAGAATNPLVAYMDTLTNKQMHILIPGGGLGHELAYLWDKGFQQAYLLDFAPDTASRIHSTYPQIPPQNILTQDFFAHKGQYDLILEQTFFCALPPTSRQAYADKMKSLLKPGGKLVGVLFDFPLTAEGPPFGGSRAEYLQYFGSFCSVSIEPCLNSIKPRLGKELFIEITA